MLLTPALCCAVLCVPARRLQALVDAGPTPPPGESGAKFIIRKDGRRINLGFIRDGTSRSLEVCGATAAAAATATTQVLQHIKDPSCCTAVVCARYAALWQRDVLRPVCCGATGPNPKCRPYKLCCCTFV